MRIRLRQIVMVAADATPVEARIEQELGLDVCVRDHGVAAFGLGNVLFPIGEQLLEVITPIDEGTTAGRFLERRGGDGGYMVLLQVDDLAAMRERFDAVGARVVYEAVAPGIVGLHLNPADVGGAILSVDESDDWDDWPWAGDDWRSHRRTDRVTAVVAVEIAAHDPGAMASRWSEVLGRPVEGTSVPVDGGRIEFVPAGERGEGVDGFVLRAAPGAQPVDVTVGGCRFRSVTRP
jgi:hypothetical protein